MRTTDSGVRPTPDNTIIMRSVPLLYNKKVYNWINLPYGDFAK